MNLNMKRVLATLNNMGSIIQNAGALNNSTWQQSANAVGAAYVTLFNHLAGL